jgi:hypothetical protein
MLSDYNQTSVLSHPRKDFTKMQLHGQIHYCEAGVKLWSESEGVPHVCVLPCGLTRGGACLKKMSIVLFVVQRKYS